MPNRAILTIVLESHYGQLDIIEQAALMRRAAEWGELVMKENNTEGKHLGMHFTIRAVILEEERS